MKKKKLEKCVSKKMHKMKSEDIIKKQKLAIAFSKCRKPKK